MQILSDELKKLGLARLDTREQQSPRRHRWRSSVIVFVDRRLPSLLLGILIGGCNLTQQLIQVQTHVLSIVPTATTTILAVRSLAVVQSHHFFTIVIVVITEPSELRRELCLQRPSFLGVHVVE